MAGAAFCEITGLICSVDGAPKVGAQVRATISSTEEDQGGQVVAGAGVTSDVISAITQDDGTFTLQVMQGANIFLEIPDINLKKSIVVPLNVTAVFSDLI